MTAPSRAGWFPIHRRIFGSWPWQLPPAQFKVFVWVIGRARWGQEEDRWFHAGQFHTVRRGQFITSIRKAADAVGVTPKAVRRALEIMEKDGMIRCERAHGFTLITLCNYEKYQVGQLEAGTDKDTPRDTQEGTDRAQDRAQVGPTEEERKACFNQSEKKGNEEAEASGSDCPDPDAFAFENWIVESLRPVWKGEINSFDQKRIREMIEKYGADRERWQEKINACGENKAGNIRYLQGCWDKELAELEAQKVRAQLELDKEEWVSDPHARNEFGYTKAEIEASQRAAKRKQDEYTGQSLNEMTKGAPTINLKTGEVKPGWNG